MPLEQNISFWAGESVVITCRIVTGKEIIMAAEVDSGATSLTVKPITEALSSGDKIYFYNGVVATLSGDAVVGATTLSVAALPGDLKSNDRGRKIQNLTSWTNFIATFSRQDGTQVIQKTQADGITKTDEDEGLLQIALATGDTDNFTSIYNSWDLWLADSGAEAMLVYGECKVRTGMTDVVPPS